MDGITITPELEQFAVEAVLSGRFRDLDDVVRTGLELLRRQEQTRTELVASVLAAQAEGDKNGYLTGDEVAAHVRQSIASRIPRPASW